MTDRTDPFLRGTRGRNPAYSPRNVLLATAVLATVVASVVVAVVNPVATAVVVAFALVARPAVRALGGLLHTRRRERESRDVCVTAADTC